MKITGNVEVETKSLKKQENFQKHTKSKEVMGCPLSGAVVCALAKTTSKPINIEKEKHPIPAYWRIKMQIPLIFLDTRLWLVVTAITLLIIADLISPYYGQTN